MIKLLKNTLFMDPCLGSSCLHLLVPPYKLKPYGMRKKLTQKGSLVFSHNGTLKLISISMVKQVIHGDP